MSATMKYTDAKVHDDQGNEIGSITDVIYEGSDDTPTWFVVKTGLLRGEHYVPCKGSYRTADDNIVVPFTDDQIKAAPKAKGDHVLTDEDRALLGQHYHLDN